MREEGQGTHRLDRARHVEHGDFMACAAERDRGREAGDGRADDEELDGDKVRVAFACERLGWASGVTGERWVRTG